MAEVTLAEAGSVPGPGLRAPQGRVDVLRTTALCCSNRLTRSLASFHGRERCGSGRGHSQPRPSEAKFSCQQRLHRCGETLKAHVGPQGWRARI